MARKSNLTRILIAVSILTLILASALMLLKRREVLPFLNQIAHGCNHTGLCDGYVPDEDTATGIAETILAHNFRNGARIVEDQRPLHAQLRNGIWYVEGTPHGGSADTAFVEIAKDDGRILNAYIKITLH